MRTCNVANRKLVQRGQASSASACSALSAAHMPMVLQGLLADTRADRIEILVIYKVDRLTQSPTNFARLVEIFDAQDATFVPLRSTSIRRARCGAPHAQFAAHH